MLDYSYKEDSKELHIMMPIILNSQNRDEIDESISDTLKEATDDWNTLIVDFSNTTLVDSVGLNLIVSLYKKSKYQNYTIKALIKNRAILSALKVTNLDKY
ncbi:MAG: STAS domain-containing protein, partial [Verrucomicrobiota bacterium]